MKISFNPAQNKLTISSGFFYHKNNSIFDIFLLNRSYSIAALSDVSISIPISVSETAPFHDVDFKLGQDPLLAAEKFCGDHWEEVFIY